MTYRGIILGLLLISCSADKGTENKSIIEEEIADSSTVNLNAQENQTPDSTVKYEEDFSSFFEKFSSDSVFQKSRVLFPFSEISYDIEDNQSTSSINEDDWKFIHLKYDSTNYYREIDGYEQIFEVNSDKAKVGYRGIDNGIYFDYIFENQDGNWILTSFIDYSN